VPHLLQARRTDAQSRTGFLHPAGAGQDLHRHLEPLLGFRRRIELVHIFPSGRIASTHGRVLSRSDAGKASCLPGVASPSMAVSTSDMVGHSLRHDSGPSLARSLFRQDYPGSLAVAVAVRTADPAWGSGTSGCNRAANVNARTTGLRRRPFFWV